MKTVGPTGRRLCLIRFLADWLAIAGAAALPPPSRGRVGVGVTRTFSTSLFGAYSRKSMARLPPSPSPTRGEGIRTGGIGSESTRRAPSCELFTRKPYERTAPFAGVENISVSPKLGESDLQQKA